MPRQPPVDLTERLIGYVKSNPKGIGVEELLRQLEGKVSRRTLQRQLSALVRTGRLINEGAGRSTIYLLSKPSGLEEEYVPLSPSGAEVRQLIRRPQSERTPVSYNRAFLDQYRPNESRYLTAETIAHLTRIGATADLERPAGTYARHILDRLLVDLSWASSRLEGNTYSLLDTQRLIQFGEAAEGTDVVGNIVRGGLAPTVDAVTKVARERVPAEQLDDFVRMTINDLENLHEGNFARFRLRPSEFHAWSEMQKRSERT